jgi:hypothetical protein
MHIIGKCEKASDDNPKMNHTEKGKPHRTLGDIYALVGCGFGES